MNRIRQNADDAGASEVALLLDERCAPTAAADLIGEGPCVCAYNDGIFSETDFASIVAYVMEMPRTEVVEQIDHYIHAEASSALFGFVDDLELLLDISNGSIQARSVSRLGDSDLGVNANRLRELQSLVSP